MAVKTERERERERERETYILALGLFMICCVPDWFCFCCTT